LSLKWSALSIAIVGVVCIVFGIMFIIEAGNAEQKVADEIAEECRKLGVKAVGNYDSVTDFNKAKAMIDQAISEFGKLDILVNNAGILRDRMLFNMSEQEFDDVIAVHLKGTFNMTRHAAAYFREQGLRHTARRVLASARTFYKEKEIIL